MYDLRTPLKVVNAAEGARRLPDVRTVTIKGTVNPI